MTAGGTFTELFSAKPLGGMIHLPALPTAPRSSAALDEIVTFACEEQERLEAAGLDGTIVENVGDAPFFRDQVPPATVAAMAIVVREVVRHAKVPVGVNILRNAWREALEIAYVSGAAFIRCNVVIGAYVTDQGIIQGEAAELARLRKSLDRDVLVFGDIHVKHSAPLFNVPLVDAAQDLAERGGVDAVILSGRRSPTPPSAEDVIAVADAIDLPVVIGSGVGMANVAELYSVAGGVWLGEVDFKVNQIWGGESDPAAYAAAVERCRPAS